MPRPIPLVDPVTKAPPFRLNAHGRSSCRLRIGHDWRIVRVWQQTRGCAASDSVAAAGGDASDGCTRLFRAVAERQPWRPEGCDRVGLAPARGRRFGGLSGRGCTRACTNLGSSPGLAGGRVDRQRECGVDRGQSAGKRRVEALREFWKPGHGAAGLGLHSRTAISACARCTTSAGPSFMTMSQGQPGHVRAKHPLALAAAARRLERRHGISMTAALRCGRPSGSAGGFRPA